MKENQKLRHSLYLLLAAFIWGMAFVSQSKGMDYMGPLTFNGVRSLIGATVLALYLFVTRRVGGYGKRQPGEQSPGEPSPSGDGNPWGTRETRKQVAANDNGNPWGTRESRKQVAANDDRNPWGTRETRKQVAANGNGNPWGMRENRKQVAANDGRNPWDTRETRKQMAANGNGNLWGTRETRKQVAANDGRNPDTMRENQQRTVPGGGRNITLRAGICCGLALTAASTLQQIGIQHTTVGKAGFITTLYIIFVPIAGIFFQKRVSRIVWAGAVMAAAGMYLLCMTESLSLGTGDILVFFCALVFTAHILLVDYFSPRADGVMISCIQFAVCGILCTIGALIWEEPSWGQLRDGLGMLAYAGVLSCGVAYTLQIVGQKGVNPTVAALLLSLESVFATVSAWIAYRVGFLKTDQTMTGRQIAGCVLVFAAVILVQLPAGWFRGFKRRRKA